MSIAADRHSALRPSYDRHTPPPGLAFGEPDDRLQRSIQYAAASRLHHCVSGILDRPPARAMTTESVAPHRRHCERSEAIHLSFCCGHGLLRCARNDVDVVSRTSSTSRRQASEALLLFSAQRGRGECRVPAAPAVSCALVLAKRTRATTSTPESPGIPARNGFNGLLRTLPGDRALLPPSFANLRCVRSPVGPTQHPRT